MQAFTADNTLGRELVIHGEHWRIIGWNPQTQRIKVVCRDRDVRGDWTVRAVLWALKMGWMTLQ